MGMYLLAACVLLLFPGGRKVIFFCVIAVVSWYGFLFGFSEWKSGKIKNSEIEVKVLDNPYISYDMHRFKYFNVRVPVQINNNSSHRMSSVRLTIVGSLNGYPIVTRNTMAIESIPPRASNREIVEFHHIGYGEGVERYEVFVPLKTAFGKKAHKLEWSAKIIDVRSY